MKSLLELMQVVTSELGNLCRVSTTRDFLTITRRVENEGISFLTITLPEFGKDLERSLELGRVAPEAWTGFSSSRCGLPRFLGGFLEQIFDTENGVVLDEASVDAIFAVRQISGLFAKVELDCSPGRVKAAYDKYIECETQVGRVGEGISPGLLGDFHRVGRLLFARAFARVDNAAANFTLLPSHGPGATANGLGGNAKFAHFGWTARLDRVFPYTEYLVPNVRFHQSVDCDDLRDSGAEEPVKVIHVPKTLKTPRIIAMEPSYMMYAQQALWRELRPVLEHDPLIGGLIGFGDQDANRNLARIGSVDASLATLDLSEASDRVSNLLVQTLCKNHPHFDEAVQASRSTHADVLGHGVIPLSKFASMGSALCFPFEAMVFLTIIVLAMEKQDGTQYQWSHVKRLHRKVRVFGDDIIVPKEYAVCVMKELETFGLVVNTRKSFWNGKFRESCGGDFYAGHDVRPIRVRRLVPTSRMDVEEVVSFSSFRNQMWERGLERTVEYCDNILLKVLDGLYPYVPQNSPLVGRFTYEPILPDGIHRDTHNFVQRGWRAIPKKRRNSLDGVGALMKYFLSAGDLPVTDSEHLIYSGRPVSVALKKRTVRMWETTF